jgi:hypothetical protein
MSIKATWLSGVNLSNELDILSGKTTLPILANTLFWTDLKKSNLIDWEISSGGVRVCVVNTHPVYQDPNAPDYTCTQEIVDYYWSKHGSKLGSTPDPDVCQCNLGGVHEFWCDKWQPY